MAVTSSATPRGRYSIISNGFLAMKRNLEYTLPVGYIFLTYYTNITLTFSGDHILYSYFIIFFFDYIKMYTHTHSLRILLQIFPTLISQELRKTQPFHMGRSFPITDFRFRKNIPVFRSLSSFKIKIRELREYDTDVHIMRVIISLAWVI